ncbi:hypothetical protein BZG36_02028 [Bifiguratus adelaidae]|uniref:BTB domain-containing protein n=1 Tax=Bifiguratus adelaidae TaxID=1938954 RepID=A0A261Y216_9FUNG|nr:hypothetical protein BZG36_02028 [Bifiguratus adelaidae]
MNSLYTAILHNNVAQFASLLYGIGVDNTKRPSGTRRSVSGQVGTTPPRYPGSVGGQQRIHFDVNKRSNSGRTLLQVATSLNRTEIVRLLVDAGANVNITDRESGWTSLHRALYHGYLETAMILLERPDLNIAIKDHDGNTAFDLLNSTIEGTNPSLENKVAPKARPLQPNDLADMLPETEHVADRLSNSHTELYTWGANANYVLGQSDSDNRAYPERVVVASKSQSSSFVMNRSQTSVVNVEMAKLHTAAITSDDMDNLFLCGFGNGGRLGGGMETQLRFTAVPGFGSVKTVALGRDHSVVVTTKGDVWTFGSNQYGQLGYPTDIREDEEPVQLSPRKIIAAIKKEVIVGAAASRVHTVVYSECDVFTFGLNQGQLGYHRTGNEANQIVPRKVTVIPPGQRVKQVVVTDTATAIMLVNSDVIVLYEFGHSKIVFPMDQFPSSMQIYKHTPKYITRLVSGGDGYLGAISNVGEFFVWPTPSPHAVQQIPGVNPPGGTLTSNLPTRNRFQMMPRRAWTLRKSHFILRDAAIGQNGSVIVCTESGHVFMGTPRKEVKNDRGRGEIKLYKYVRIPYIQRAIMVRANPSGAFAVIKETAPIAPIEVRGPSLGSDLLLHLPDVRGSNGKLMASQNQATSDAFASVENGHICQAVEYHQNGHPEKGDVAADAYVIIGQHRVPVHQIVLAARCPVFCNIFEQLQHGKMKAFEIDCGSISVAVAATKGKHERERRAIEIKFFHCHLMTAKLLLKYLYSDEYDMPWHSTFRSSSVVSSDLAPTVIRQQLVDLAEGLELAPLRTSVLSPYKQLPPPTLFRHLKDVLDHSDRYRKFADVIVQAKDDARFLAHEAIIKRRCPFFEAMFGMDRVWVKDRQSRHADGMIVVHMEHVRPDVMKIALMHMYTDDSNPFDEMEFESMDDFMNFVIDVLAVADELLLDRLKELSEQALLSTVNVRNVTFCLEIADLYHAEQLRRECLDYICRNIESVLESRLLSNVSEDILLQVQKYLQMKQTAKMPISRQAMSVPTALDEEEKQSSTANLYNEGLDVYETIRPALTDKKASLKAKVPVFSEADDDLVFQMDEDHQRAATQSPKDRRSNHRPTSGEQLEWTLVNGKRRSIAEPSSFETKSGVSLPSPKQFGQTPPGSNSWKLESSPKSAKAMWSTATPPRAELPSRRFTHRSRPSMRNIFDEQANSSQQSIIEGPRSSSWREESYPEAIVPVVIKTKLSQKERRRQQQQQQQQQESTPVTDAGPAKTVWGTPKVTNTSKRSPHVSTFPEFPALGAKVTTGESSVLHTNSEHPGSVRSQKSSVLQDVSSTVVTTEGTRGLRIHMENAGPSTGNLSTNPAIRWTPIGKSASTKVYASDADSPSTPSSFAFIQEQQLQERSKRAGKPKKSLVRIQVEEQAIEGLREFHLQTAEIGAGEWFTIERV